MTSREGHAGDLGLVLGTVPVYAAYGSNMDPEQMAQRAPHSPVRGSGWLQGWRLTFGGDDLSREGALDGALATIVEDPDEHVFVVLYDVPEWDETSLDQWEGATRGLYHKVRLRVQTLDGEVVAWFYVLDGYEGGLPSARYLGILSDAAEKAGAPDDYVKALRNRPCTSFGG
ncbi:gamma-glutamyl cyclotransferase [Planomonospora sphaerica]|uniref:Gamma-glutamyl cyclotransferase n=1 Tax=Planomonospora sphaerica TaxID=161355 RepID=A0A171CEA5_9ACTN|nr:gamma-glutamyl cyclotransferase [Planomonospora sphaerica]